MPLEGIQCLESCARQVPLTRSASYGFTLLELLIAVALLGLVVVLTVPAMTSMSERRQTTAAVERIYSELQLARCDVERLTGDWG